MTKKEIREEELKKINGGKDPEVEHNWYCEKTKTTHGEKEESNWNPGFLSTDKDK